MTTRNDAIEMVRAVSMQRALADQATPAQPAELPVWEGLLAWEEGR